MMALGLESGMVLLRAVLVGLCAMLVFGVFEQWPRRLPRPLARWVLQVAGVAVTLPLFAALVFALTNTAEGVPFYRDQAAMQGYSTITGLGMLLAPWVALGALVRQKDALARHQALAFELERTQLERRALEARLQLMQAQVAPHFLFNTLANVQALVETGSPQAAAVLKSLIAYLRAAVPRLNEAATTIGRELELVKAYLDLMYMRMPDRLQFSLHADDEVRSLRCPPLTLLTLVENAVRHGVDPSEVGGRIDVQVLRHGGRCLVRVSDTGVGLATGGEASGTGLATLSQRLQLAFDGDARLRLSAIHPRGACAELEFPAREGSA